MINTLRRFALHIAVASLLVNLIMLIASSVLWWMAIDRHWLDKVEFVSHVSMLALLFSAISGVAAGLAGLLTLIPTDDILNRDG